MEALTTALTTGLTGAANQMMSALGTIAPAVLPVVAGVAVVTLGVKFFRKVTGA